MRDMAEEKDIMENRQQEALLFQDACTIIEQAQESAYRQVNEALIKRNWLLGMRIQHEVLKDRRAEYGEQVVKNLAERLTEKYGKGFISRNLHHFVDFYMKHTDIFYAVSKEPVIVNAASSQLPKAAGNIVNAVSSQLPIASEGILQAVNGKSENILQSLTPKLPIRLSWTHYRIILQEGSKEARDWYEQEAAREMWSTRTLQRNVSSQYYHRLLKSQDKTLVHDEMLKVTSPLQDRLEHYICPSGKTCVVR